jgi:hypothetical protein
MRSRYRLGIIGWLLMPILAFGQTNQQASPSQSTGASPADAQPANQKPVKPSALDAAARASKEARESAAPIKVIRNHDLRDASDPRDTGKSAAPAAAQITPDKAADEEEQREVRDFEAQGKIFQNQVKVQKGKIIDIQNRITSLQNQFTSWSFGFAQDDEAQACWTSTYYTPYYKDWCDRGRNLQAQYEASQRQLAEEKGKLEQMQEDIRRKGYGNGVYDPD